MSMILTVTHVGFLALINARHNGTGAVTISQFGVSPDALVPDETMTALPGEVKRIATLSGDQVDADTIHLIVRDDSQDSYTMRSWGLYLEDGTLFAIYGEADPIIAKAPASIMMLAVDAKFANLDVSELAFGDTNFLNPPATTSVRGVAELATPAEVLAGLDQERIVVPADLRAAVIAWLDARFGVGNSSVWTPLNDGAGSGLDADLWRGQTPAQFLTAYITQALVLNRLGFAPVNKAGDIMTGLLQLSGAPTANMHAANKKYVDDLVAGAGIGFTPVNRAGDMMTGRLVLSADPTNAMHAVPKQYADSLTTAAAILAKLLTVDGASSGLDADLWRGQTPAQFLSSYITQALVLDRLGYAPVSRAGDTMTGRLLLSADPTSSLHAVTKQYADALATAAAIRGKLLTVDGAGSGIDADLLDGYDSAAFLRVTDAVMAASGYRVTSDGMKECWGTATVGAGGTANVAYPITFSSWNKLTLGASIKASGGTDAKTGWTSRNNSGFTLRNVESDVVTTVDWHARGI